MDLFNIRRALATLAEIGSPQYTGVSLSTSAQAIPIPILWGQRRVTPNLIWQTNHRVQLGLMIGGIGVGPATSASVNIIIDGPDRAGTGYTHAPGGFPGPTGFVPNFTGLVAPLTPVVGAWSGHLLLDETGFGGPHPAPYGYGSNDALSSSSVAWVPMIFGLCEGPVDAVPQMWNGGGSAAISMTPNAPYNPTLKTPALFYFVATGSSVQNAWGYFASADASTGGPFYTGQALSYRRTAYVASALVCCGHDLKPPQQSFEVLRTPDPTARKLDSNSLGYDYSLATIIPDLLTNLIYGMGFTSFDVDPTSLAFFLQYQYAQGFYFSPLLTAQASAVSVLDRWAVISNTWIFWSGTQVMFVPLGDEAVTANGQTYTPDVTPAYNLGMDDFLVPVTVDRADPIDCHNRVRLEFTDRASNYAKLPIEWKDETLINQFGIRDASSVNGEDICDVAVAAKSIELFGKRMAYLRNRYTLTVSYRFIRILPGTIVTLTEPNLGLNLTPVRVQSIQEDGQGQLAIVAEEYPGTLGISRPQITQGWSQSTGVQGGAGGTGTSSIGGASVGPPTPTAGGVLVMDPSMTFILFVAGDVITLPNPMPVGVQFRYLHDQQRSPQPTPATCTANPVTFQRPGGATFLIEDPTDGTKAPSASVSFRGPDGAMVTLVNTGESPNAIIRFR